MNQEQNAINEEQAAINLKEVYQKFDQDHADQPTSSEDETSSGDAQEQLKGSDADMDKNVGYDDTSDANEPAEPLKSSDADIDRSE